jgi:general secretion pathway protein K
MNAGWTPGDGEGGSIAILALWALALISLLLAPVAFATRGTLQITRNALAESQARHAAEAGTQLGLARLLRRQGTGPTYFDGSPEAWRQGSTRVSISIADEAGKIDLNVAPLTLLTGLFAAVGTGQEAAELLACNVLDRRGEFPADCPEQGGAHIGRRFVMPEQLAELPGINDALYDRIADCVTVATGASAIDPRVAPRTVLMAIPGASESFVDAFLRERATWQDLAATAGLVPTAAAPFLMATPGRDFTIVSIATTEGATSEGGARYRAELQVRLTGRVAQPYEVVAWRTPSADRDSQPPRAARRVP